MKKAEQMAWGAMGGVLGLAVVLIGVGWWYHVSMFWAGGMMCAGQGLVMGLAAYGLSLARQAAELREGEGLLGTRQGGGAGGRGDTETRRQGEGFRMSMGTEDAAPATVAGEEEARVLDTTFQRTLVFISGLMLTIFSLLTFWMLMTVYRWSQANPNVKVPIAGTLESVGKPKLWIGFDEYALLAGLVASGTYVVLYFMTRPSRRTGVHGMAASSNFTLGLTGMAGLGAASVLAYFKVVWVSELAAAVLAGLMLLQGLELFVNAFRSYSNIEEMDQESVDLQATPLGPMLNSIWLGGVRMLVAQSVGLSGGKKKGERGVIARMMPRALAAVVVLAVGMSCFRVVPPGTVAVLERLGYTPLDAEGRPTAESMLKPGLHVTLPWPIDVLVQIPTVQLQTVDLGTELHAPDNWKNIDFQFWMVRPKSTNGMADEAKDLFITGDPGSPQVLETFVEVSWRVADNSNGDPRVAAARFYSAMSHSEYFQQTEGGGTEELPIYEALVQQATSYAVTKTFAIHSMDQILVNDRAEVEEHCRQILQDKLDSLCLLPGEDPKTPHRAIEVAYLTIKDLHPPYGGPDKYNPNAPAVGGVMTEVNGRYQLVNDPRRPSTWDRGPASAFELVVTMREFEQEAITTAQGEAVKAKNQAHGTAVSMIAQEEAEASRKVAQAHGEADRFVAMTKDMSPAELDLMKRRLLFDTAKDLTDPSKDLYGPVTKIVVDPKVSDVVIIQNTERGGVGTLVPGGQ